MLVEYEVKIVADLVHVHVFRSFASVGEEKAKKVRSVDEVALVAECSNKTAPRHVLEAHIELVQCLLGEMCDNDWSYQSTTIIRLLL